MEKTITVPNLVEQYINATTSLEKDIVIKKIKSEKYINYEEKDKQVNRIIQATMMDENGNTYIKNHMKYVLFPYAMLEMYTNIQVNTNNLDDFDLLNSSGLLDRLLVPKEDEYEIIPVKELAECQMLLDVKSDDFMYNHRLSIELQKNISPIIEEITKKINRVCIEDILKAIVQ